MSKVKRFKERITFEQLILKMLKDTWRIARKFYVDFDNPEIDEVNVVPQTRNTLSALETHVYALISFLEGIDEISKEIEEVKEKYNDEIQQGLQILEHLKHTYVNRAKKMQYLNYAYTTIYRAYLKKIREIIRILHKHNLLLREKEVLRGVEQSA